MDINKTDAKSIERELSKMMKEHDDVKLLFVTNSRVSDVARFVEQKQKKVLLVGYDFLPKNIEFLEKEIIDFLICQNHRSRPIRRDGFISAPSRSSYDRKNSVHAD